MKKIIKTLFKIIFKIEKILNIEDIIYLYNYFKLKSKLKKCGSGVAFQFPIIVKNPQCLSIGNEVVISSFVHFWAGGEIEIGNSVLIGSHSSIVSETHDYTIPDMFHSHVKGKIKIGNNVWIGTHVVIFPNVTIGDGAVIGAGSIVNRNVNPNEIVAGVPAKKIKTRIING